MNGKNYLSQKFSKIVSLGVVSIAFGCYTFLLNSCVYAPPSTTGSKPSGQQIKDVVDVNAAQYNQEFATAVTEADVVIVREHSHPSDLSNVTNLNKKTAKYTYAKKELSFTERMTFVEDLSNLKGKSRTATTRCLFVPHHSIELYKGGKLTSTMGICYNCSEIRWDGSSLATSGDIFDAITPLLKRSGMKAHRDWQSKAQAKFEENLIGPTNDSPATNPENNPVVNQVPTAKWVTGQEGKKVINPYTGSTVDVEGIPAGLKVRDPNDKDKTHVFFVPAL